MLSKVRNSFECQIILIEPFMFCNDIDNPMFVDLKNYRNVVAGLAQKFNTVFMDIQNIIDKEIEDYPLSKWSDDMVHPTSWTHEWIAEKWLKFAKVC